jgi:hypothetical protein
MRNLYQRYREVKVLLESAPPATHRPTAVIQREADEQFLQRSPDNRKRVHLKQEGT